MASAGRKPAGKRAKNSQIKILRNIGESPKFKRSNKPTGEVRFCKTKNQNCSSGISGEITDNLPEFAYFLGKISLESTRLQGFARR
jgi:hypothetical protein